MPGSRFALILALLTTYAAAWQTFVVPHVDGQDDTPALSAALATGGISANTTILFEKGKTYNIFTPIVFPTLNNVEVAIEGNMTYPDDMATIQSEFHCIAYQTSTYLVVRHCRIICKRRRARICSSTYSRLLMF